MSHGSVPQVLWLQGLCVYRLVDLHAHFSGNGFSARCFSFSESRRSFVSSETMESSSNANEGGTSNYTESLLCHYLFSDGSAQFIFLDLVDEGSAVVNQSLSFCSEINVHICALYNGLLLLSSLQDNMLCFNLFNLFTKQCVSLPPPQIARRSIRTGLACAGLEYQVIRIFSIEGEAGNVASSSSSSASPAPGSGGLLEMEIFSSETNVWRHHRPLIQLPPDLPKLDTAPLFSNGVIYWELGGYLLIYHVNHGHCRLVELPNYPQKWCLDSLTFGQCLWESEGCLHYCYSDFEGIHTWVLLEEQDLNYYPHYYGYDHDNFRWKLAHTITHENLMSRNPDIFLRIGQRNTSFLEWEPYFISPFVYIESYQTMYLRLPGSIVSYNLRTQTMKEICSFEFPRLNFYCCLLFPGVCGLQSDSQVGNIKRGRGTGTGIGDVVSLPITDALPTKSR